MVAPVLSEFYKISKEWTTIFGGRSCGGLPGDDGVEGGTWGPWRGYSEVNFPIESWDVVVFVLSQDQPPFLSPGRDNNV